MTRRGLLTYGFSSGVIMTIAAACSQAPVPAATTSATAPTAGGQTAPTAGPAAQAPTQTAAVAAKPAGGGPPVVVQVWTFVDAINGADTRGRATKLITERFQLQQPNVQVQFEVTPWPQLGNKYQAAWEAGNAPDLVWVRMDWLAPEVRQGSLAVIDDRVAKWSKETLDDLAWPTLWEKGVVGGKRYGLYQWPIVNSPMLRQDVADRVGVKPLEAKTFDNWIQMLQKMTIDKAGKSNGEPGFDETQVQVWGYGEGRARNGGNDLKLEAVMLSAGETLLKTDNSANWTSPTGIRALTYWTDLAKNLKVEPSEDVTRDQATADKGFVGGLYAQYGGGSAKFLDFTTNAKTWDAKTSLAPMPQPGIDKWSPVEAPSWFLGMNSKAKSPDQAWAWLDFYLSRDGDLETVKTGGQLPVRKSTVTDAFFQSPGGKFVKAYLDMVAANGSFVSAYATSPVNPSDDLLLAFQSIVVDNVPVEKAANDAADAYNARLKDAPKQ